MVDRKTKALFDKIMKDFTSKQNLTEGFKKMALRGFDTFEDYEKYGDMFVTPIFEEAEDEL